MVVWLLPLVWLVVHAYSKSGYAYLASSKLQSIRSRCRQPPPPVRRHAFLRRLHPPLSMFVSPLYFVLHTTISQISDRSLHLCRGASLLVAAIESCSTIVVIVISTEVAPYIRAKNMTTHTHVENLSPCTCTTSPHPLRACIVASTQSIDRPLGQPPERLVRAA